MTCLVCGAPSVVQALDLGSHPVASFFLQPGQSEERRVPLAVGQCGDCATIQLMKPIPADALIPPYDWLTAREPEAHLDAVVDQLMSLPGVGASSTVAGVSYKDDTTLDRFTARGVGKTWRVDLVADLGLADPAAGVETLQKHLTATATRRVAGSRGQADILIVRHVAEHAEDPRAFLAGCAELIADGGYIVVEVPDCTRSLELNDYAMVWEEHSLYLTPATTEQLLVRSGFATVALDVHPFPFENSIVLVGRKASAASPPEPPAAERARLGDYASAFAPVTADLRAKLARAAERGPVAIFGAGHLACAFVNFHGLEDLIAFVVDDTPQKQNLRLPGARTPILPSASLVERGASLCLLAVSPQSEDGIIARNSAFQDQGGVFRSVLAASGRSIRGDYP